MATLTTFFNTHYSYFFNSHSKLKLSQSFILSNPLHLQPVVGFTVLQAIRSPKFHSNSQIFDDEYFINGNSKKRRIRKRKNEDEFEEEEEEDNGAEIEVGIFQQMIGNLWILKVFKSYGWFSPIILFSLLITTGLKAFVMAFSISFGLSVVFFAFQKLQERLVGSPKPRRRRKRRSKYGRRMDAFMDEEVDQEESQQAKRNRKRDYQPWVVRNNGSFNKSNPGSRNNVDNFGGWDDLVGEDETQRSQRPSRETGRLQTMLEKERLSRSMKERDLPMLLRLLIAVFPFLASWIELG